MTGNWLNLVGLCYDIAGAVMLGRAVVLSSREKIAMQVGTAWGYNKHLIPVIVEQWFDGILGLSLLVVGFLIQGASDFRQGEMIDVVVGVAILVVVLIGYFLALPRLVERWTKKVVAYMEWRIEKSR
jgi:hypothetical protein